MATNTIHKAAGILVRGRKLLVTRSYGKTFFIAPGGKLELAETAERALVRELMEECRITVDATDIAPYGTFTAEAAGQKDRLVEMQIYWVHKWVGEPIADNEVEELRWITSQPQPGVTIGSIFWHDVIPLLKAKNLID